MKATIKEHSSGMDYIPEADSVTELSKFENVILGDNTPDGREIIIDDICGFVRKVRFENKYSTHYAIIFMPQ